MPSKSPKQARTMAAAAHDAGFAAKVGIPVSVAREFHAADKAQEGKDGGKKERRERLVRELTKGG